MKRRILPLLFLFAFLMPVTYISAQTDVDLAAEMITKGLDYLKATQSISGKGPVQFESGPSIDPNNVFPMFESKSIGHWSNNAGITALCLQAFLAQGYTINDPVYGATILNAINYIIATQTTSGTHLGGIANWQYGYETPQCIVALKSAIKTGGLVDPLYTQVQNVLASALNYITQDINPAWSAVSWRYHRGYTSEYGGDMSVNQWNFLALNEMNYTDKNVYQKIYTYLNNKSYFSGTTARIGYQNYYDWTRGNTAAGIWGAIICNGRGVPGAAALAQKYYNFIEQNSLSELFSPSNIGSHVYDGGGWYYYTYELAKALALGQKTNFAGGNWYTHMVNNFWNWKGTSGGNYYWDGWGGQGSYMETALVILSLQTNTIPVNSSLHVSMSSLSASCLKFSIFDNNGNFAGDDGYGNWITNIPNSHWSETGPENFELIIDLADAMTVSTQIENVCKAPVLATLCYRSFINESMTDEDCFDIPIDDGQIIGSVGFVNSIGGLNVIIIIPPSPVPVMAIDPQLLCINPFELGTLYSFEFTVSETGGETALEDIDIIASDLVDQFGNIIPAGNFTFNPENIAEILAGGSTTVEGTILIPATFPQPPGLFDGIITIQSISGQTKAIQVTVGAPSLTVTPAVIDVPNTSGSTTFSIEIAGVCGNGWTISDIPSWLNLSATAGSGSQVINIDYAENLLDARSATLLISAPNAANPEETVTINQAAGTIIEADQLISIPEAGWFGISSFIIPDEPLLTDLMAPIVDNLVVMLSNGGFYWPEQGVNTIVNWNTYEGYKIKVTAPGILPVNGLAANKTVTLPIGVSFLPVLSDVPVSTEQILGPAGNKLLYACDIHTYDVYWPGGGLNTLPNLIPGTGYLVYMLQSHTFDFDVVSDNSITQPVQQFNSPWNFTKTGDLHFIGFNPQALSPFQTGDIIGVFNASDQCTGAAQFNGSGLVLFANGDDQTSAIIDGMVNSERMNFKVYRPSTGETFNMGVTFDPTSINTDRFESNGISIVKTLELLTGIPETALNSVSVFPNPTTGTISATFGLIAGRVEVSVINTRGQLVASANFDSSVANSTISFDLSKQPKGVYFIRLTNESSTRTEKFVIN